MGHICLLPENLDITRWYGLELHRKVEVVEKYTLGEARSAAVLSWDKDAMSCFRAGVMRISFYSVSILRKIICKQ